MRKPVLGWEDGAGGRTGDWQFSLYSPLQKKTIYLYVDSLENGWYRSIVDNERAGSFTTPAALKAANAILEGVEG